MSWLIRSVLSLVGGVASLHLLAMLLPQRSSASRYASFLARLVASFSMLVLCACYGVLASLALRMVGLGGLGQWTTARAFKWTMWLTTGVKVEIVRGKEYLDPWYAGEVDGKKIVGERRARVMVGNHQTELDVLILGGVFPKYTSVTAKKSLKYTPFLGWFMTLSKTVFIDRANRASALSAFDGAAKTMRNEKQSVFIFPEGTRSYASTPTLLPFKKGAFHLAVQAQVPILPVVAANYSHILDTKKKIFRAGTLPVSVLKPIETKGLTSKDVDGLCTKVRELMLEELIRLDKEIKAQNGYVNGSATKKLEPEIAVASGADVDKGTKIAS